MNKCIFLNIEKKSYLDPISYFYQSSTIMAVNNYWVFNKIAQLCASKKKKNFVLL